MIPALIAATLVTGAQLPIKVGTAAPAFTAKGTDGNSHSLASLTEKGDVFLYFISHDCPINAQAVKYINRLEKAYHGKATIVGIINGDAAIYKKWQSQFKGPYKVLYDPDLEIIKSYKANASPWMIRVSKGKIAKVWAGYSTEYLKEMNAALASSAKVKVAKVDFAGAPPNTQFG